MKIVRVNEIHISTGWPGSSASCPVALALNDRFSHGLPDNWIVNSRRAVQYENYVPNRSFRLGLRARRFINRVDTGKKVRPFRFILWGV